MRRRLPMPRTGTVVAATSATVVSLAPGLLPRTPAAQGLLTGVLVALFIGAASIFRVLMRHSRFGSIPWWSYPAISAVCASAVVIAIVQAEWWQNRLRAAMGFPDVGVGHWVECAIAALFVAATLIGCSRATRWAVRRVLRTRGVTVLTVTALTMPIAVLPVLPEGVRTTDARADTTTGSAATDSATAQPGSASLSESVDSASSWSGLGTQGRRFVSADTGPAVRVYVGLGSAPDLNSRVALALRALERSRGLERSNIVAMAPTGSGWVDAQAVTGMNRRFGGDVAMVALQYSDTPSWMSYVFGRRAAEQAQKALFTALEQRLSGLKHPPRLYIYGQSLGATAGSSVFADDADQQRRVCAALWAGPPADRVHHAGARILANSSDPVVQWSPELLWHAPDLTDTRRDAPHPPWIPVVGFVQTSTDLLSALTPAPGHGHRYGADQGTALGTCR